MALGRTCLSPVSGTTQMREAPLPATRVRNMRADAARSPQLKGTALRRKLLVPVLVVLLGVAAIAAITVLQERERQSQSAELKLSQLQLALAKLQDAPYKANAATGGSAALAAGLMRRGEAQIATTLAELQKSDPARRPSRRCRLRSPSSTPCSIASTRSASLPAATTSRRAAWSRVAGRAQAAAVGPASTRPAPSTRDRVHDVDSEAIVGAAAAILAPGRRVLRVPLHPESSGCSRRAAARHCPTR